MTKIPDQTSIARKTVHIAPDIASYDARAAGTGIAAIGVSLGELERAETQHQVAKAEADFLIAQSEQDNAYDQDEDYGTIQERYSGAMNEALGASASRISNPRARTAFVNRYTPRVAEGEERIAKVAWGTEVDSELAEMQEQSDKLRESAITGDDQSMLDANATMASRLQAAEDMGYINDQDRVRMFKGWKVSLASGRLDMMKPEQVLSSLSQQWANNLPADVRAQYRKKAEKELKILREKAEKDYIESRAIGLVDGFMAEIEAGGSPTDIGKKLGKIKNSKLRKEAEDRFVRQYNFNNKMEVEQQSDYRDKYYSDVALGKITDLEEIPEWNIPAGDPGAMDAGTKSTLINARNASARGTKIATTVETYEEILDLYGKGERGVEGAWTDLRVALNTATEEGRLSTDDYEKYMKISQDGEVPDDAKYIVKDQAAIAGRIAGSKDAPKRRVMLKYMGEWRMDYLNRNNGKQPSERERNDAIDRALLEYEYEKRFWNDPEMPVYQMTVEQRREAINIVMKEEPRLYNTAIQALSDEGIINPSDAQILHAYRLASGE